MNSPQPKMKESVHADAKKRLARIAGQVNGLQKMVDEERYCVDILTQVAALRAALDQFGVLMLSTHLENCVYGHDHGETAAARADHLDDDLAGPFDLLTQVFAAGGERGAPSLKKGAQELC